MNVPNASSAAANPGKHAGSALRRRAKDEFRKAMTFLARRGGRVHEGFHQGRKSLRRARAILALGSAALGPGGALIDRELQQLNRTLSSWRDGQALVEAIDRVSRRIEDAADAAMLRRARRVAIAARAALGRAANGEGSPLPDALALMRVLRGALLALPWDAVTSIDVDTAIARSRARLDDAARKAFRDDAGADDWHRLRKRIRRLTQQHTAMAGAGLVDALAVADAEERKALKKIARQMGEMQDCILLHDHCGRSSPFLKADRKVLRGIVDSAAQNLRTKIREGMAAHFPSATNEAATAAVASDAE